MSVIVGLDPRRTALAVVKAAVEKNFGLSGDEADPLHAMALLGFDPQYDAELRRRALSDLLKYTYHTMKSVDMSLDAQVDGEIRLQWAQPLVDQVVADEVADGAD